MPEKYDLYGFVEERLESVRAAVESALAITLERRDSSFRGGEYFHCGLGNGDEFILQINHDEALEEWAEDGFQKYPTLLYATTRYDDDKVEREIASVGGELLRRQVL